MKSKLGSKGLALTLLVGTLLGVTTPATVGVSVAKADSCIHSSFTPNEEIDARAKKAWDFFKKNGYSDGAAAAKLGNLWQESKIQPTLVNSIGAKGIAQWLGGRANNLDAFAASKGKGWSDLEIQLEFLEHELTTSKQHFMDAAEINKNGVGYEPCMTEGGFPLVQRTFQGSIEDFKKAKGTKEDILYWAQGILMGFEIPGGEEANFKARAEAALYYYEKFHGSSPSGGLESPQSGTNNGGSVGVSEDDLEGLPNVDYLYKNQGSVEQADGNQLSASEKFNLARIKEDIDSRNQENQKDVPRTVVPLLGITTYLWALIVGVSIAIDYTGIFPFKATNMALFRGQGKEVPVRVGVQVIIGALIVGTIFVTGIVYTIFGGTLQYLWQYLGQF